MIFILTVSQDNTADLSAKTGKLYLVDLAGSQKIAKTGARLQQLNFYMHYLVQMYTGIWLIQIYGTGLFSFEFDLCEN